MAISDVIDLLELLLTLLIYIDTVYKKKKKQLDPISSENFEAQFL